MVIMKDTSKNSHLPTLISFHITSELFPYNIIHSSGTAYTQPDEAVSQNKRTPHGEEPIKEPPPPYASQTQ